MQGKQNKINEPSIKNNEEIVAFKSDFSSFIGSTYGSISITENRNLISCGSNGWGFLGHDEISDIIYPPKQIPNVNEIKMIDCGILHTIYLNFEGKLFSIGNDEFGQLGIGNKYEIYSPAIPVQINDIPFIDSISCGKDFTVCITSDRLVYSFGDNGYGQLGTGDFKNYSTPQLIKNLTNVELIQCGMDHTLCKTYSNEYYGWGENYNGELGQRNNESPNTPTICLNWPEDIIDLKCGCSYSLLLTARGNVYSFGKNYFGQLGLNIDEYIIAITTPRLINDLPLIKRIECGYYHSMCIDINDNLWVFGNNNCGQLGLGDKEHRYKPTLNESLQDIIDISSGGNHTFIKTKNNEIYAFGDNEYSQLGIETSEKYLSTPIQVFKDNEEIWASNTRRSKQKSARN